MKNKVIGFIGTGVMGQGMVRNLLKKGFKVNLHTRTKVKATQLIAEGAEWMFSVKQLSEKSDVIITMIGTPRDVEAVYFGSDGLIENSKPGTLLIDMTTSKPSLAKNIYDIANVKGIQSLDAPVSGGDVGAQNGKLTIMVGGDEAAFNEALPVFEAMGENIRLQGPAGAGQHTKVVNQVSIAPAMIGMVEALVYAEKAHLDPELVLKSIGTGAAGSWSLDNYAPRIIKGNYDPGFAIKHFIKDMEIAVESAEELGLYAPGLNLALSMYKELEVKGHGEKGIHALMLYYQNA
ncbi:MAG TPA: NAD(P)-dependent oxidoreductase [Pseudogracilibacillus sp.]|nr:NAD(P)-dependent oxidoreductase [Pseudogracilibacillus sp.]